jgi:hypothetical protein
MKTLELDKATAPLVQYARGVKKEPLIFTSHGKPIVALIYIPNADAETISLSTNPQFLAIIERSRLRQEKEGGISSDEMRRRLGIKRTQRTNTRRKDSGKSNGA